MTAKKVAMVSLPEQNEGRFIRGYLVLDSADVDEVLDCLNGLQLGVMGNDLSDHNVKIVDLLTPLEYRSKQLKEKQGRKKDPF